MAPFRMLFLTLLFSQGKLASGEMNIYDKPMSDCGPDHGAGCTYVPYDAGAHQVCVTSLPHGFSSNTGQGSWSDQYTGQPWCICIWAYSNYILHSGDLPLKCESIPSKVLEEQYSLDKFKQCGSMSSSEGCGAEDIRRSIQTLCTQCKSEATDDASKAALKSKCDAILAVAPAAPMRLYEDASKTMGIQHFQSVGEVSPFIMGTVGMLAAALVMISVRMLYTMHRQRDTVSEQDEVTLESPLPVE